MHTILLDKRVHNRQNFDCDEKALNNYLKSIASQQGAKDNARTYVLIDTNKINDGSTIIGFYTLTMSTLTLYGLPPKLQKKHQSAQTAGLIARMAVDKKYQGKGLGEWLLVDALKRLLSASNEVGFPLVIVDAKHSALGFYEKYGFSAFLDQDNKLFMTVADIRLSSDK